jgi:hypothetical protein
VSIFDGRSVERFARTWCGPTAREIAVLHRGDEPPAVGIRVGRGTTHIFADHFPGVLEACRLCRVIAPATEVFTVRLRTLAVSAHRDAVRLHWLRDDGPPRILGNFYGAELDALARAVCRAKQLMATAA